MKWIQCCNLEGMLKVKVKDLLRMQHKKLIKTQETERILIKLSRMIMITDNDNDTSYEIHNKKTHL